MIYTIFGTLIRPIFIDFVGPIIPFISYFWLIRSKGDLECGGIKEKELSVINYSYLLLTNIGQVMAILLIMIRHRNTFKEQREKFSKNAVLKA